MNKVSLLAVLLSLVLPFDTVAEDRDGSALESKTQLEAIHGKIGTTVIEGYSVVGKVNANDDFGSTISVENWEFIDSSKDEKQLGMIVEIRLIRQSSRSFIDYKEIDPLLQGIDSLLEVDRNSTKLDNFQAIYRTKDGLEITTFSRSRNEASGGSHGDIEATVKSGNSASLTLSTHKLRELQSLIAKAKQQLDLIFPLAPL